MCPTLSAYSQSFSSGDVQHKRGWPHAIGIPAAPHTKGGNKDVSWVAGAGVRFRRVHKQERAGEVGTGQSRQGLASSHAGGREACGASPLPQVGGWADLRK